VHTLADELLKLEDIIEEGEFRNTDQNRKSVMCVTSDRVRQLHFIGTAIKPEQPDAQRGSTMIRKMIPVFTAAAISMSISFIIPVGITAVTNRHGVT